MKKSMKRILAAALTLFLGAAIVTVALPEGARAASSHSNHRLCNETICPHDGEHTSITSWTAWNSSTSLPNSAGNYYLTKNVTLANPITLSKDMVLCLNGNTITYTGTGSSAKDADYGIHVRAANVRICNCHEEGGFTMPSDIVNDPVESLIYVQANATDAKGSQLDLFNVNIKNLKSDAIHLGTGTASHMNIYGGEISGCTVFRGAMFLSGNGPSQVHLYGDFKIANNTATEYAYNNAAGVLLSGSTNLYMHDNTAVTGNYTNAIGGIGGIAVHGQGSLYMYDNASVTNNRGHILGVGGIDVPAYYNYLYVKDNVKVTGNTVGSTKVNNVNLTSYNTPIRLYNKLTSGASIGVTMETPSTFTTNWTSRMGADAVPTDYFFSDSSAYEVIKSGNEAALTAHVHNYTYTASGATITAECACGTTGSVTIQAPAQQTSAKATVSGSISGVTTPNVYYEGTGSTVYEKSTTVPTVPGSYRASITLGGVTASVDYQYIIPHTHPVCGDSACADHSSIDWMPTDVLPTEAGNYYLTRDITLTSTWEIHDDIQLCLNGHTITYALTSSTKSAGIYISAPSYEVRSIDTAFTNCGTTGGITADTSIDAASTNLIYVSAEYGTEWLSGGGYIEWFSKAKLDLYNIDITDVHTSTVLSVGGSNSNNSALTVNMYDSTISNCTSGSYVCYIGASKDAALNMYGTSAIRNNTATSWTVYVTGGQLNMYDTSAIENNECNVKPSYSGSTAGVGGVYVAVQDNDTLYGASMSMHDNSAIRNNSGYRVGGIHAYYIPSFSGDEATAQVVRLYDNASVTGNVGGSSGRIGGGIFLHGKTDYTAQMVVGDNVNISGNALKNGTTNNVYLENEFCAVVPDDSLSTNANIGISMKTPGQFTQNWETVMGTAAVPTDYFFSDNTNYIVTKIGTELYLTEAPKVAEVTTWPTASNLVYGDKLSASTLTGGEASVEGTFSWSNGNEVPAAGTKEYAVTFTPTDSAYAPVTGKVSLNVAKADPSVVWPTNDLNWPYNTQLKEIPLNNGSATVEGSFEWVNPNTRPDAGTASHAVRFVPTNTDNYNTVEGSVEIRVSKAPAWVLKEPTASDLTYGQSLSQSTFSDYEHSVAGTYAWADPTFVPEVGTHEYEVIFTPSSSNYETVSIMVTVKVNPAATGITSAPTASEITEGQSLADSILSGGDASVDGTFAWADPDTVPTVGTHEYDVIFTPANGNYEKVTIKVSITVNCAHVFSEKIEDEAHFVAGSGADCQHAKRYYYDCTKCDQMGTTTFASETFGPHSMSTEWSTENEQHFHACTVNGCDYKEDSEPCHGGTATCTAKAVCEDCGEAYGKLAEHDFSEKIADEDHFVAGSGINCQDAKEYYYDCSKCNTMSTTLTFEEGFGNHVPAETATSNGDGTHSVRCTVDGCNHTISTQDCDGPAATCTTASICDTCGYTIKDLLGHDMNTAWTSQGASGHIRYCARNCGHSETDVHHMPCLWTYVDGTTHTRSCEDNCGYSETANHAGGEASCSSKATCTDCQSQYGNTLPHDWKEDFQYDEEGHWHDCENCNATSTVEPHNPGPEATEESEQVCLDCGFILHEVLEHVHKPEFVPADPATCTKDGTIAHYLCRCGLLFSDADGLNQITNIVDPQLGHDMPDTWTMLDESYHTRACSRNCGYSETAPHAMGDWTYLNETEHQHSCTEAGCNFTETEDHKGGEANCNDPAQCSTCGEHYGEALEHDMPNAWTFLNEEVHQRFCEHGCGHSETDEHHMSAWTYVDENTHQRVCTDETLTRKVITACGWVQTAEHSDEDGDGNCDGCAQQMPGTGDGGDGEGGNEGEGGGNTEGDKDDTPNTGDRHMFLLIAAAALFLIGALGAGFKYVYAKRNRFF